MSDDTSFKPSRRRVLQGLGAALAAPTLWLPTAARAQTAAHGTVRHLLYVHLGGGFRFTAAFNGDVADGFNPFGPSRARQSGTQWGVSSLLERSDSWLGGATPSEEQQERRRLGMEPVSRFSAEMCVLPCVDHEPFARGADGNHGTGLERFLTGSVGGATSVFSYLNYGMRERVAQAAAQGRVLLPAFSLGEAGMAAGAGRFAAFRPPVLEGSSLDRFGFDASASLPAWASRLVNRVDERMRARVHSTHLPSVDAYMGTRAATATYGKIFSDEMLKVGNRSTTAVDGISNRELELLLGTETEGRRAALALRLFHFGCPAVFLGQGGYDMHSGEEQSLPGAMERLNRLVSGLRAALKRMDHPQGGKYWDHTLVVLGSEFGRTTGSGRFNSAAGSDHSSDLATRWMSMPLMGGPVLAWGKGGARLGETRASDLKATGPVYSYRGLMKTLMDVLGADHSEAFPSDPLVYDLFT
jgi:uncharacterized protein (DUF1501 family)